MLHVNLQLIFVKFSFFFEAAISRKELEFQSLNLYSTSVSYQPWASLSLNFIMWEVSMTIPILQRCYYYQRLRIKPCHIIDTINFNGNFTLIFSFQRILFFKPVPFSPAISEPHGNFTTLVVSLQSQITGLSGKGVILFLFLILD